MTLNPDQESIIAGACAFGLLLMTLRWMWWAGGQK
jgi:hypothetical protein